MNRRAVLTLPGHMLLLFNQPENTGERLVMRAMVRGLIGLHIGVLVDENDALGSQINDDVLDNPGARLLHVFSNNNPIQDLLIDAAEAATFLSPEDYEFGKCELSNGRRLLNPPKTLVSRSECTEFLNRLVDDMWESIKRALASFNRESLVRTVLGVHESAISDRHHWRLTAAGSFVVTLVRSRCIRNHERARVVPNKHSVTG